MQDSEGLTVCLNRTSWAVPLELLLLFEGDLLIRETTEKSTPPLQEILVFLLPTNPQASTIPCLQQNGKGWNQLNWAQPSANHSDTRGGSSQSELWDDNGFLLGDPKPKARAPALTLSPAQPHGLAQTLLCVTSDEVPAAAPAPPE